MLHNYRSYTWNTQSVLMCLSLDYECMQHCNQGQCWPCLLKILVYCLCRRSSGTLFLLYSYILYPLHCLSKLRNCTYTLLRSLIELLKSQCPYSTSQIEHRLNLQITQNQVIRLVQCSDSLDLYCSTQPTRGCYSLVPSLIRITSAKIHLPFVCFSSLTHSSR